MHEHQPASEGVDLPLWGTIIPRGRSTEGELRPTWGPRASCADLDEASASREMTSRRILLRAVDTCRSFSSPSGIPSIVRAFTTFWLILVTMSYAAVENAFSSP